MANTYIAIDLKSFYASVECVERGLDPLVTNLVVADPTRTDKTICLAVSPSLKAYGIPGRTRLFEVNRKISSINESRLAKLNDKIFTGKSFCSEYIANDNTLEVGFIIAPPRMALYIEYSTKIYQIYMRYVDKNDIHIYSIDEVFIDATKYLNLYKISAIDFTRKIISDVLNETGITATAGIGTNLYLCKIAMDIEAKHIAPDKYGVRIAELNEISYRKKLWNHQPLTDFWRVGHGYMKRLNECGIYTMGDIARCSLGKDNEYYNEELLYKLFGVNAELLIDHAWGWEPCTMEDIKKYRPEDNSLSSGQVLQSAYSYGKGLLVLSEMAESLSLEMVSKKLVSNQLVITIGYDVENEGYNGDCTLDRYGRKVPKHSHGSINLDMYTSSSSIFIEKSKSLFEKIVDAKLFIRRINITACHVIKDEMYNKEQSTMQLDLFTDYENKEKNDKIESVNREKQGQEAVVAIKNKYGKNAILKGINLKEGATAKSRNEQIGGHKA